MSEGGALTIDVQSSGIWQMSSTVISANGACLVVDPGYFPRELVELEVLARARGEVLAVAFTHGHWDHVIGWQTFPEAPVWTSPSLARAIAQTSDVARKNLADAAEFDGRYYVQRPAPLRWPERALGLEEGQPLQVGTMQLLPLLLPGHSEDGLALLLPQQEVLLVGDYLSPCEIPFVEDLHAYRTTLQRLLHLLPAVRSVIPGHGPRLSRAEAQRIATEDLSYLDQLLLLAEQGNLATAKALPLPRAAAVPGMAEHHIENCGRAEAAAKRT